MGPAGLANFLAPIFRAARTEHGVYLLEGQNWTSSYYVGAITLALAAAGVKRRLGWTLALVVVGSLVLAQGILPISLFRYPIKLVVPGVFCLIALAGLGLAEWAEGSRRRVFWWGCLILGVAIIGIALAAAPDWKGVGNAAARLVALSVGTALLIRPRAWTPEALMILLAVDIATHMPWQNPTISAEYLKPGDSGAKWRSEKGSARSFLTLEAYEALRARMLPDKTNDFLIRRETLLQNLNLIDGLPKLDGFFSLYTMREREFRLALYTSDLSEIQPALDFLGVARFSKPGAVTEWETRATALPLVTVGQAPQMMREGQILRRMLKPDFRPLETVFLHDRAVEAAPLMREIATTTVRVAASAKVVRFEPKRIEIAVSNATPVMMVVAESYDPNWSARADGKELRVRRVNYDFIGLELPANTKAVVLEYRSKAWARGLWVALGSAIILGGVARGRLFSRRT